MIAASTPLLLAAAGELVVERSGVLNLGVEGMMIVGAACGFAGAYLTGFDRGRRALRHLRRRGAGARSSASLTLGLAVNQVATGLALTILGVGLSGLIGAGFVGERIVPAPHLTLPVLTDLPFVGRILFGEDAFVYLSIALIVGIWLVPLPHAGRPGPARRRRQPCLGACARLSGAADPHAARCCSAAPAPGSAAPICRSPIRRSSSPA